MLAYLFCIFVMTIRMETSIVVMKIMEKKYWSEFFSFDFGLKYDLDMIF